MQRRRSSKPKGEKRRKDKEPKIEENVKRAFFLRSKKTSNICTSFMSDLHSLKKPDATKLGERIEINAFEDDSELERISKSLDHSLFCVAAHSKKHPHCLTMGRMFDGHLLDMLELSVDPTSFLPTEKFNTGNAIKPHIGFRPCFSFVGAEWENDEAFSKMRNLLLDWFHGVHGANINLQGVRHVISCIALPDRKFRFAVYSLNYSGDSVENQQQQTPETQSDNEEKPEKEKEEESKTESKEEIDTTGMETEILRNIDGNGPKIEGLIEVGPRAVVEIRRTKFAAESLMKEANKRPQQTIPHKTKNITREPLEGKTGRVYPNKQDVGKLGRTLRLTKALRPPRAKKQHTEGQSNQAAAMEEND